MNLEPNRGKPSRSALYHQVLCNQHKRMTKNCRHTVTQLLLLGWVMKHKTGTLSESHATENKPPLRPHHSQDN